MNILILGDRGMVGSALVNYLKSYTSNKIITAKRDELDLLNQESVKLFFKKNMIDQVYLAAAKVGGIYANNTYPANFIYENLMIQSNVIHASHCSDVDKLLFLGSSCIYPKLAVQPINEDSLLTGLLEPTNEPYAIAKISGIKLCESYNRQYGRDFRSVMPTNLYGPNDNFHPENSHVIPAMINRLHDAKENNKDHTIIWGSGNPKREFLHVEDMASACAHIMNLDKDEYTNSTLPMLSHINIGSGKELTIKRLAETISKVIGYKGELVFDSSKPDGTPRKILDVSRLRSLGWESSISLETGLKDTYEWYLKNYGNLRSF